MLNADQPVLMHVYYDSRMAVTYPNAYQFLRNNKADNGIYLLFTEPISNKIHEAALL